MHQQTVTQEKCSEMLLDITTDQFFRFIIQARNKK